MQTGFKPSLFVLDDPDTNCRSTASWRTAFPNAPVTLCSDNPSIEEFDDDRCGVYAMCGYSTHTLQDLIEMSGVRQTKGKSPIRFDAMFLDYCKTANASNGWLDDVRLSLSLLRNTACPIYLTFSRRYLANTETLVATALRAEIPNLVVTDTYQYHDSHNMTIFTILPRSDAQRHPPLTSYIVPQKNELVRVRAPESWTGIVKRQLTYHELEVYDIVDKAVYTVKLSELDRFDPKKGLLQVSVDPKLLEDAYSATSPIQPSSSQSPSSSSSSPSSSSSSQSQSPSSSSQSPSSASTHVDVESDSDSDSGLAPTYTSRVKRRARGNAPARKRVAINSDSDSESDSETDTQVIDLSLDSDDADEQYALEIPPPLRTQYLVPKGSLDGRARTQFYTVLDELVADKTWTTQGVRVEQVAQWLREKYPIWPYHDQKSASTWINGPVQRATQRYLDEGVDQGLFLTKDVKRATQRQYWLNRTTTTN